MTTNLYDNWLMNGITVTATFAIIALCVLTHYEGLQLISRRLPHLRSTARFKMVMVIAGVLCLHVIEIWMFGLSAWLLLHLPDAGSIAGDSHPHLFDVVYLSASSYTTVGYGDLAPRGALRFLFGTEALTGFVMITWSASFTYLEMERFWRR
ncbi:MAG: ion channel [Perlucidibaca sp.]